MSSYQNEPEWEERGASPATPASLPYATSAFSPPDSLRAAPGRRAEINQLTQTLPEIRECLRAVESGEKLALALFKGCGLQEQYSLSQVHDYDEVRDQALAVITYASDYKQRVVRACKTFAAHPFDDKFDRPEETQTRALFKACGYNLRSFIEQWGAWGELTLRLLQLEPRQRELCEKGFTRAAFGGLLLHCCPDERSELWQAYIAESTRLLAPEVAAFIRSLEPAAYELSTKTTLEMVESNANAAEVSSVLYGPLVAHHDQHEELKKGEARLQAGLGEGALANMVRQAGRLMLQYEPHPAARLHQLKFVYGFLKTNTHGAPLPALLAAAYEEVIHSLETTVRQPLRTAALPPLG